MVIVILGSIIVQPVILSLLKVITCMWVSAHWEVMVVVGGGWKGLHP
jgi:hypothetical protein